MCKFDSSLLLLITQLQQKINKLQDEIDVKDKKLAQQEEDFKKVKDEKRDMKQDLKVVERKLSSSRQECQQLLDEKKNLETERKQRKEEITTLKTVIQTNKLEALEKIISQRQKEIDTLNQQLLAVENDLKNAKVQTAEYEEQIQKMRTALKEKRTELESLQTVCTKTKCELGLEREKFDRLHMQQTAAKESQDKFKQETQVRT